MRAARYANYQRERHATPKQIIGKIVRKNRRNRNNGKDNRKIIGKRGLRYANQNLQESPAMPNKQAQKRHPCEHRVRFTQL